MKNKQQTQSDQRSKTMSVFLMMFMAFILTSFAGFAQQSAPQAPNHAQGTAPAIRPVEKVSVLQFAEMHPQDEYLARAASMQRAVDNPAAYPKLTKENLEEYKAKLAVVNLQINEYEQHLKSGDSQDVAFAKFQASKSK
jgi:hypothetical protein